jgi:hypothetical protein
MNPLNAFASVGLVLFLGGCTGTETGNPVADQQPDPPGVAPPSYDNPPAFDPPTGGPSGEPCDDFPRPETSAWWRLGSLLVGTDRYRGLVTVDVTNPANPTLQGEFALPSARQFHQLEAREADGVREVIVALSEAPSLVTDALPAETDYDTVDKLLRFDVSDPSVPRLIEELTLPGRFVHFLARADRSWIMTTSLPSAPGSCPYFAGDCYSPDRLQVTGYRNVDGSWQTIDSIDLPAERYATLTELGVVSVAADQVHVARIDQGVLGAVHSVSADTSWNARTLRLTASELQVVLQDPLSNQPRVLLQRFVSTEAGFSAPSDTLLGEPEYHGDWEAWFSGDHLFVSLGRDQVTAQVWSLGEAETLPLTLPEPMQHIVPLSALQNPGDAIAALVECTPTRAIAWRGEPDALPDTMSLLAITEGAVEILDDWALPAGTADFEGGVERRGFLHHSNVALHETHLVAREIGNRGPFSAIAIDGDTLVEAGSLDADFPVSEMAVGDSFFFAEDLGLRSGRWSEGELHELRWTDYVVFHTAAAGIDASLLTATTSPTRTQALRLERDGERWEFPLGETQGVVLPGNDVLLVPILNDSACDNTGDNCVEQEPRVMVFGLDDVPELVAEVPLPDEVNELASAVDEADVGWLLDDENPPLQLDDGRWLFAAELRRACDSESECEALGAEATFNETDDAWGGNLYQRYFYALNVGADGSAAWSEPALVTLTGQRSGFGRAFVSSGQFHVTRLESPEEPLTEPESVRVFVDRFELDEDGTFRALPSVNVPGFPVGTLADGRWLTVAPRTGSGGAGTLHRVRVFGDAAFVDDSLDIAGSYVDLDLAGNTAVYLSEPSELCGGPRVLNTISLGPNLVLRSSLELSPNWGPWELAALDARHVVLSRGYSNRQFAAFELVETGAASFVSLLPSHCDRDLGDALEFTQGVLTCAAGGWGVERLEF